MSSFHPLTNQKCSDEHSSKPRRGRPRKNSAGGEITAIDPRLSDNSEFDDNIEESFGEEYDEEVVEEDDEDEEGVVEEGIDEVDEEAEREATSAGARPEYRCEICP